MSDERENLSHELFGTVMREMAQTTAEDVADIGKTLKLVHDFCSQHVAEVRSAVIHEKPRSLIECEYVWKHTDRWIDFPWPVLPPVIERQGQVRDA
ncbi:phosphoribosyltransferase [Nocardiopsis alkaliphila]|nr:hypothetical protein [Nocardiopsis alkaliphila]